MSEKKLSLKERVEKLEYDIKQGTVGRQFILDQIIKIQDELHIFDQITGKLTQIDAWQASIEKRLKKVKQ